MADLYTVEGNWVLVTSEKEQRQRVDGAELRNPVYPTPVHIDLPKIPLPEADSRGGGQRGEGATRADVSLSYPELGAVGSPPRGVRRERCSPLNYPVVGGGIVTMTTEPGYRFPTVWCPC